MLVLSRNAHDGIIIGGDVEVTILAISGNTVKLGITAPVDVPVHRSEVYVQIEHENHTAAQSLPISPPLKTLTSGSELS